MPAAACHLKMNEDLHMLLKPWVKCERGAAAVEYGLMLAGIAVAISAVVFTIGPELADLFNGISYILADAMRI
jgi:Flp pilus assembly pilin Flp